MRYLITGGSGTIGFALAKALAISVPTENVMITYLSRKPPQDIVESKELDIRDRGATTALIRSFRPDVVIHSGAITNVDLCETDHALADAVNVQGTANVLEACRNAGCKIVYISTVAVFDGAKSVYAEEDTPNPINYNGFTKFKSEELCRAYARHLIVRTDQPYGLVEQWHKKNTVLRVVEKVRAGESVREPTDWYNMPTYIPDLVNAIAKLLEGNATGTYHVVGPDFLNRYEWALRVARAFALDETKIVPITSEEFKLPAKRQRVRLSIDKITKLGIKMRGVEDGAREMKKLLES